MTMFLLHPVSLCVSLLSSSGPCPPGHSDSVQPLPRRRFAGVSRATMRGRCSRKLGVLAKAFFLLWCLWLAYLLMARSSSSSPDSSEGEDGGGRSLLVRQFMEERGEEGQLAKPVYIKAPADLNAPGEWGRATRLNLSPDEKKLEEDSVERYAINIFVSDKISLHRHIQDHRMSE